MAMPFTTRAPGSSRPRSSSALSASAAPRSASSSPRLATRPIYAEDEPEEGEEWDAPGSEFLNAPQATPAGKRRASRRSRKKKDEPMKPTTVIRTSTPIAPLTETVYVIIFYTIWQILTRSTETEILSHLSPSSPHHYHLSSLLPESTSSPYHLPYQFPHIPSPLPPTQVPSGAPQPSTTRWVLGILVYPFYLLLLPLGYIFNILAFLLTILATLAYPLTHTGRILAQIFVRTPYAWIRSIATAIYPIYVFVGGMIGVGCVMGLGAGWAGKKCLEWAIGGRRAPAEGKQEKVSERPWKSSSSRVGRDHINERGFRTSPHPDLQYRSSQNGTRPSGRRDDSGSSSESVPPRYPRTPQTTYRREIMADVPSLFPGDSVSRRGEGRGYEQSYGKGKASAREGHVIGTRRRGVRYDDE